MIDERFAFLPTTAFGLGANVSNVAGSATADFTTRITHRGARTHDHKVKGLALCRLS